MRHSRQAAEFYRHGVKHADKYSKFNSNNIIRQNTFFKGSRSTMWKVPIAANPQKHL